MIFAVILSILAGFSDALSQYGDKALFFLLGCGSSWFIRIGIESKKNKIRLLENTVNALISAADAFHKELHNHQAVSYTMTAKNHLSEINYLSNVSCDRMDDLEKLLPEKEYDKLKGEHYKWILDITSHHPLHQTKNGKSSLPSGELKALHTIHKNYMSHLGGLKSAVCQGTIKLVKPN